MDGRRLMNANKILFEEVLVVVVLVVVPEMEEERDLDVVLA